TGTAQKHGDDGTYKKDAYVCSFIGFTPVEDPEIVLLVILDEPNDGSSTSPSAVAAEMFADMLPYMNIYPVTDQPEDETYDRSQTDESADDTTNTTETTDEE
ncbi:MAG: penicillin-binding protein 2, partial [Firmicutes bacterium]|nr:penicillin-binding protein 2 [Bacillota bacterium]